MTFHPGPISKNKIFYWVLFAHLVLLGAIFLLTSASRKRFVTTEVTTVDLIEPVELAPVPAKEEAAPEPETEPEPPPKEKKIEPAPPKKITKKIETLALPPSDLKERLEKKLSRLAEQPAAPKRATESPPAGAVSGRKFPFSYYTNFISSKIYSLWKRPSKSAVGKEEATALVSFRVYRDGHIESVKITRSSGSRFMDESVLGATRMADPLPPLPTGFKGAYEDFEIRFRLSD